MHLWILICVAGGVLVIGSGLTQACAPSRDFFACRAAHLGIAPEDWLAAHRRCVRSYQRGAAGLLFGGIGLMALAMMAAMMRWAPGMG